MKNLTAGTWNDAFGYQSQDSANGSLNSSFGAQSLRSNTGTNNVAFGSNALVNNLSGSRNVAIGSNLGNSQGSENIAVGYAAGGVGTITGSHNIAIGTNINFPSLTASNQLNIGNLIFGTGVSGTGTTIAGNVGVGTTTPFATLQIATTTGKNLVLSDSGAGTNLKHWLFSSKGGNLYIGSTTDAYATSTTPFTILNTGNIGIGTSTPGQRLSVAGDILGNNHIGSYFTATSSTATSTFSGGLNVAGTSGLTVLQNGNVGIGTTSPATKLEVDGQHVAGKGLIYARGLSDHGIISADTDTPLTKQAGFTWMYGGVSKWESYVGYGSTDLKFYSDSLVADVLTLASTGNVGIGTTSPAQRLEVYNSNGSATSLVRMSNGNSTYPYAEFGLDVAAPTFGAGVFVSGTQQAHFANGGLSLGSYVANTAPSNGLIVSGNVGIGSTTPWRTFSVAGTVAMNGLTSSATGNAVCITTTKDITDAGGASCVPSSIRFKENVQALPQGYALDEFNKLRVVSFDYKAGFYSPEDQKGSYGMIAEEVEQIDPKLVDYGYDGQPLTLKFEKLTGLAIQAIQELSKTVAALAEKVSGHDRRITTLEAEVATLKAQLGQGGQGSWITIVDVPAPDPAPEATSTNTGVNPTPPAESFPDNTPPAPEPTVLEVTSTPE